MKTGYNFGALDGAKGVLKQLDLGHTFSVVCLHSKKWDALLVHIFSLS